MNRILRWLGLVAFTGTNLLAQSNAPVKGPAYPRVNLATAFVVDTNWPQRPPEINWGAVPGVAVDKHDRVWIRTRTNPTVQVYSADGRYLFGWRDDRPGALAHFIRIDQEDHVWMAENWVHCIALDSKGNVYLGDIMGKRVQKFVPRR